MSPQAPSPTASEPSPRIARWKLILLIAPVAYGLSELTKHNRWLQAGAMIALFAVFHLVVKAFSRNEEEDIAD